MNHPTLTSSQASGGYVRMAAERIARLFESLMEPSDLTIEQYLLLGEIARRDSESAGIADLAGALGIERREVKEHVRVLVDEGLMRLSSEWRHDGSECVELTEAGRDKFRSTHPQWHEVHADFNGVPH